ncbi:MAG TPA: VTT domain-containing protein [Gemmatimonadaceae bacterium]|nr:VTT domain-containing protein [Gemmatimonadaceae bacterium]
MLFFPLILQRAVAIPELPTLGFWGQLWAYITLATTSIVTEEAAPLLGGVAAQQGQLGLVRVAMALSLGTWGWGVALYFLGRWRGKWVRARWPRVRRYLTRALRFVRRHPWRSSFAVRYAYGLRLTLPIACGAAHVPLPAFLVGSAASSITWSSLFTVLGWAFGRTAMQVLRHVKRFEDVITLAAVGVVGVLILVITRSARGGDPTDRLPPAEAAGTPTPVVPHVAFDPESEELRERVERRRKG